MKFSDKDPDEIEFVGFSFVARLASGEAILTAAFDVSVVSGVDPSPANMLQGAAQIDGATVKQKIGGGVAGVHYRVGVEITTSAGQTLVESGSLVVKEM